MHKCVSLAAAVASLFASGASAASFTPLGDTVPGAVGRPPRGLSANGGAVVGYAVSGPFRWTSSTGPVSLATLGGPAYGIARDVSADGNVVVGIDFGANRSFRWSEAGGTEYLPDRSLDGIEGAFAVSDDGRTTVGFAGETAFLWQDDTVSILPTFPQSNRAIAFGISADGATVVGQAEVAVDGGEAGLRVHDEAARWRDGGIEALGILPYGLESQARAASADGSVIVGFSDVLFFYDGGEGHRFWEYTEEAFRWTEATGMVGIGRNAGSVEPYVAGRSRAYDVSADGNIIAGSATFGRGGGGGAALWIGDSGPLQVYEMLISQGATGLEGWTLDSVEAISADGRTIAGDGLYCFENGSCLGQGWTATLDVAVVPAPPAAWLLGTGIAGLAAWGRKRRERARTTGFTIS